MTDRGAPRSTDPTTHTAGRLPLTPGAPVTAAPAATLTTPAGPGGRDAPFQDWITADWWHRDKPGRSAPFLPSRQRAYDHAAAQARQTLTFILLEIGLVADSPTALACAVAVRGACADAFATRSDLTVRATVTKLTAGFAGLVAAVGLAVIAYLRWQLTPLGWLAAGVVLEGAFFAVTYAFGRFVFPGVLTWGFGAPRWSHTARLYGRTAFYLAAGVSSLVAVLTLADRHHHLTDLQKLAVASPLGGLAAVIGLWTAVGVHALGQRVRPPTDPYPGLLISVLTACGQLHRLHRSVLDEGLPSVRSHDRYRVARHLEASVRALGTDTGVGALLDGDFSPAVTAGLRAQGARVAAWVQDIQRLILSPSAADDDTARCKLSDGLLAVCRQDWSQVQTDPPPAPKPATAAGQLAKWAPRLLVTALLLAAAFIIPKLLGHTLTGAAQTTLTVTLVLTALTALASPSAAVNAVAADVGAVGAVKPPADKAGG